MTWAQDASGWLMTISDLDVSGGQRVRFIDISYNTLDVEALPDGKTFKMEKKYDRLLIFGKEVDDFHILDKLKIFALHHAAIQELDRTIKADRTKAELLEAKVTELEQKNEILEKSVEDLKALVASLTDRISALE